MDVLWGCAFKRAVHVPGNTSNALTLVKVNNTHADNLTLYLSHL